MNLFESGNSASVSDLLNVGRIKVLFALFAQTRTWPPSSKTAILFGI
jgi:hypothetical protein